MSFLLHLKLHPLTTTATELDFDLLRHFLVTFAAFILLMEPHRTDAAGAFGAKHGEDGALSTGHTAPGYGFLLSVQERFLS